MKGKQAFSVIARWRSCKYALQGVVQFVKNEHNARIHLVASIGVIVLAFALKISKVEAILLLIVTGWYG